MAWPFSRLRTYVNGFPPTIDGDDLNALQDQSALLSRLAVTGRRIADDFLQGTSTMGVLWSVTNMGTANSLVGDDASNDGSGVCASNVGAGASNTEAVSPLINIGTHDFYMHFRVRQVSGTGYNYIFGLTSAITAANTCRILVTSGGGGAMAIGLGTNGSGVALTPTLGTTYSDFVFTRVAGVFILTINGTIAYGPIAFTADMTDPYLDIYNGSGSSAEFFTDKVTLLVDQ